MNAKYKIKNLPYYLPKLFTIKVFWIDSKEYTIKYD